MVIFLCFTGLASDAYPAFQRDCVWVEGLITRFHDLLPPCHEGNTLHENFRGLSSSNARSSLVLAHLLISCAYIQVQKNLLSCGVAEALQRCISTAQHVINTLGDLKQLGSPHFHPISGTLCAMACSVFGDELTGMEILGNWDLNGLGISASPSQTSRDVLLQGLQAGMATMSVLQMDSPLISKSSICPLWPELLRLIWHK